MIVHDDDLCTLYHGDCVQVMAELPAESVDAIVTDPPYGLEFMGKEWDRLDAGLPQENVWKGRHGKGGSSVGTDDSKPASRHHVSFGSSSRAQFKRCLACGKRQFSGTPCKCEAPEWVIEHAPPGPPSGQIRMQRWHEAWAREAFRVAKPGAHLLAFGGTRTYHRLASAIEDAGWEIRDCLVWAYASGFPKSLDVSKAIDKAAGAEREVVGTAQGPGTGAGLLEQRASSFTPGELDVTAPATPDAAKWDGWGTALKPAWEPIVMARKPLRGTVAANVLAHGTGALNIDATRIGYVGEEPPDTEHWKRTSGGWKNTSTAGVVPNDNSKGRWPPNLLLSSPIFDGDTPGVVGGGSTGVSSGGNSTQIDVGSGRYNWNAGKRTTEPDGIDPGYGDSGTYSRFFLIPKSSRSDREPVLRGQLADKRKAHDSETIIERVHDPDPTAIAAYLKQHREGLGISKPEMDRRLGTVTLYSWFEGRPAGTQLPTPQMWALLKEILNLDDRYDREMTEVRVVSLEERDARSEAGDLALTRRLGGLATPRANSHPTVKPLDLMRHLVRLVTPPGGTVLDCFLGSGTTAIAANAEGFRCIGIEKEREYLDIALARMLHEPLGLGLDVAAPTRRVSTKDGVAVRHNSGGNTFGGDKAKPPMADMTYARPKRAAVPAKVEKGFDLA